MGFGRGPGNANWPGPDLTSKGRHQKQSGPMVHGFRRLSPVMILCIMQLSAVVVEHPFWKLCWWSARGRCSWRWGIRSLLMSLATGREERWAGNSWIGQQASQV